MSREACCTKSAHVVQKCHSATLFIVHRVSAESSSILTPKQGAHLDSKMACIVQH